MILAFCKNRIYYNYDPSQGSADCSSRTKSDPSPEFVNKYLSTAMLIHLLTVHGCLYTTAEALSSYSRDTIVHKANNTSYLALYRQTLLSCDLSFFFFNKLFLILFL